MRIVLLGLAFIVDSVWAASFLPIDIVERMKNSDLSIRGIYQGKSYKKLPGGRVVTEHVFSVKQSAGASANEIINKNSFKVIAPGGVWNGLRYKVSGTPHFESGDDVVLMVSKGKYGLTFPDLAMSKFQVKRKLGREVLVSEVFSNRENVGKITYEDFKIMAHSFYGEEFKDFEADKFVYGKKAKKKPGVSRKLASVEKDNQEASSGKKFSFFWLTLVLSLLGAFWSRRHTKKDE